MKKTEFTTVLTSKDLIDVKLAWKDNELQKFAINYRANITDKWYEVYRVDNYHGFLHEQKFWRNPEPIPIEDKTNWSLKMIIKYYTDKIHHNFQKYRRYYEKALRKGRINPK